MGGVRILGVKGQVLWHTRRACFHTPMPTPLEADTPRLRLRPWRDADRVPYAALNADPVVMEFFPALQDRATSDAHVDAWQAQLLAQGWGNWAVERRDTGSFIGFIGLSPRRNLPFSPCVEIGWRLARDAWGHGFASEGARAALRIGFERLALHEIVSFTALANRRSRAVMERIGMHDAHLTFDHPSVPAGHPLRPHCLYRLSRQDWASAARDD